MVSAAHEAGIVGSHQSWACSFREVESTEVGEAGETSLYPSPNGSSRRSAGGSNQLEALRIARHLLTTYQPGGLAEKEVILRQLEAPGETTTLGEAVQALRRWWMQRQLRLR